MTSHFDVPSILEANGIEFISSGKNVGRHSVNIKCPFCDDPSYHLGIHKEKGFWHCWRCDRSGNFWELKKLLNLRVPREFFSYTSLEIQSSKNSLFAYSFYDYPKNYQKFRDICLAYLIRRNVPKELLPFFKFTVFRNVLGVCCPIFDDQEPHAFIVRYINHPAGLRYYKPPQFNFSRIVGGIDLLPQNVETICIVEGPFDFVSCYKIVPTVFLCSSHLSLQQAIRISKLKLKRVLICLDGDDAKRDRKAERIASLLPSISEKVVVSFSYGDPNDLSQDELLSILSNYGVVYDQS